MFHAVVAACGCLTRPHETGQDGAALDVAVRLELSVDVGVEMYAGQMLNDVRLATQGRVPVGFFGRMCGIMPLPDEIHGEIRQEMKLGAGTFWVSGPIEVKEDPSLEADAFSAAAGKILKAAEASSRRMDMGGFAQPGTERQRFPRDASRDSPGCRQDARLPTDRQIAQAESSGRPSPRVDNPPGCRWRPVASVATGK